ncbi:MAG: hypothetical protein GC171_04080 [Terrimonas sp.]|nr:hypothetical protein [Terrimonas sp.]
MASRTINILYVSYTGRDKMIGIMQSKSFLQGHGFVIPQYFINNPDQPVFDHTPYWPPGYPLLLAPFLKLFNFQIYNATTVFDIIVGLALIFIIRRICRQIGFPKAAINIMTLVTGCFEYTFISDSLPTDAVALLFLLIAVTYFINIAGNEKTPVTRLLLASFLLVLPNFFRYAYPAVSVGIPLLLMLSGIFLKEKKKVRQGAILLAGVLCFLGLFFLYMRSTTGLFNYSLPTERGLYPENLLHWQPVVPASFINMAFLGSQLFRHWGIGTGTMMSFLEIINILALIGILAIFIRWFRARDFFKNLNPLRWFLLTGFVISMTVFLSLGYLSLTYANQNTQNGGWNYVYESRYYAFIFIFLQVCFVAILFRAKWQKKWYTLIPVVIAALMLCAEITHNLYFNTKLAFSFQTYKSAVYREQDYQYLADLIRDTKAINPGLGIMTAGYHDDYFAYRGTYEGGKGIADPLRLNEQLPKVKRKTVLFLMIYDKDKDQFASFLKNNPVKELKQFDFCRFYSLELDP